MVAVDRGNHLILATHASRGPSPDVDQLEDLLNGFWFNAVPEQVLADAGFDSETNHERLRSHGIDTMIPAKIGRPTQKLPSSCWRYLLATDFNAQDYGQRRQSETVMFMLKQHQGQADRARTEPAHLREMSLMAVTHNILIVYA
jgi:hypothetical protein